MRHLGFCCLSSATAALLLSACTGTPATQPPLPPPAQQVTEPTPPVAITSPAPPEPSHFGKFDNGMVVAITEARPGAEAEVQIGFRVGSLSMTPGLAELAAEALVQSADASQGRPSLAQAVASLGGIVQVEVGTLTTWIGIRVPGPRWQEAQAALLTALRAPAQSRGQLERVANQLVQARCKSILARPTLAMARALLLAENDTAAYVTDLLDRDPSEVGLCQARLFRPERATYALHVPGDPSAVATSLVKSMPGSLSQWTPAALTSPPTALVQRTVPGGLYWSPGPDKGMCRASLVLFLTDLLHPDAAELMVLQACLTLDGTGGRLERLQNERGLGQVRWTSEFVQSADQIALVLSSDATPADAAKLWETFGLARTSLREVPPSPSEIELARRRAKLTAGLRQTNSLARLRLQTVLRAADASMATLEQDFAELARPGTPDFERAVAEFLRLPAALVVVGGAIPDETSGVRRFEILPPGFQPIQPPDPSVQTAAAAPWLDNAAEAIGGPGLLRRLVGCESDGRLQTEAAPIAKETLSWRTDGTVQRTRLVLGSQIETRLEANVWTEQVGDQKQVLNSREAAFLRREMERHPLALLALHANGKLRFQTVAQRTVGDRDLMILQAQGERFDRLRIHIDTGSHLIRVVEVWESIPDGTTVHLQDAWSDYRSVAGMRVPFRRITTQDEGQNRVETVWSKWQPVLAAP